MRQEKRGKETDDTRPSKPIQEQDRARGVRQTQKVVGEARQRLEKTRDEKTKPARVRRTNRFCPDVDGRWDRN